MIPSSGTWQLKSTLKLCALSQTKLTQFEVRGIFFFFFFKDPFEVAVECKKICFDFPAKIISNHILQALQSGVSLQINQRVRLHRPEVVPFKRN